MGSSFDSDTAIILAASLLAAGAGYLGWRLIRARRLLPAAAMWLIALLAAFTAYFFAAFSIRLM